MNLQNPKINKRQTKPNKTPKLKFKINQNNSKVNSHYIIIKLFYTLK